MSPLDDACQRHLAHLQARHYAKATIDNKRTRLKRFTEWARALGLEDPKLITRRVLLSYQRNLYRHQRKNGKHLSARVQANHMQALKMFFSWLTKEGELDANPASDIALPKAPRRLPRDVLSEDEAEKILAAVDTSTVLGLRDRAMLELFYATGIRRAELANLDLFDVDENKARVFVREGKGKKDRVVPVSQRALRWLIQYKRDARPQLLQDEEQALFLARLGERISSRHLSHLVRAYVQSSGVAKTGSCHLFRHTMATAMLENGADVRFVQEMLGHSDLTSTQIYARVSIRKLQEIYNATHPGAKC